MSACFPKDCERKGPKGVLPFRNNGDFWANPLKMSQEYNIMKADEKYLVHLGFQSSIKQFL